MEFFFPSDFKCVFCGRDVRKGELLCEDCLLDAPFNRGKRCKLCDSQIEGEGDVCEFCKTCHKSFDRAVAPFLYAGDAKTSVLKLKDSNAKYLAPKMARLMKERLDEEGFEFDVIIPVPLSKKSKLRRGYNQSLLLAKELGILTGKEVESEKLLKTKETKHQKELSFESRQKNLAGAFTVHGGKTLLNKTVLLVDDVVTTGATANECAKVLKKYVKRVYVISFARSIYKN